MQANLYATFRQRAGVKTIQLDLAEGATMRQAVQAIIEQVPSLRPDWLDDQGVLYGHVHGFINGEDVSTLPQGWDSPLSVHDVLDFFPPVVGG
jgi:molybdopterin synthase sulfur carrier subunit